MISENQACFGSDCEAPFTGAGDLNGDGRPDIISGASGTGLRWYDNPAWTSHLIASGVYGYGNDIAVHDINGDGRQDVVSAEAAAYPSSQLVWLRQNGDSTWTKFVIDPGRGCHNLQFADANGDGRTDIYCTAPEPKDILIYFAPADPTGAWATEMIESNQLSLNLCIADIDADGTDDVVAGRAWYRRNAPGSWTRNAFTTITPPSPHSPAPDDQTPCAVLDLNGDGRLDILGLFFSDSKEGQFRAFFQPSDPTSTWPGLRIEPTNLFGVHTFKLGDFDHSGRLQVLIGESNYLGWGDGPNPNTDKVHLYRLLGPADQAASWQRTDVDTLGITEQGRTEDFDGDGWLDFAGNTKTWTTIGGIAIWTNTLGGTSSVAPSNTCVPRDPGTAQVGQSLSGSTGTWSGSAPIIACVSVVVSVIAAGASCADIAGASGASYTPVVGDVGLTVRVRVTATNSAGARRGGTRCQTAVVVAAAGGWGVWFGWGGGCVWAGECDAVVGVVVGSCWFVAGCVAADRQSGGEWVVGV